MDRHPPLLDPRSSPTPEGGGRRVPWTFVWLGVIAFLIAGTVAWVSLNPGKLPFLGGAPTPPPNGDKAVDAVAVAYVDTKAGVRLLNPVRPGLVAEVYVKEGEDVEAGQKLVKMDDAIAAQQKVEAEQALAGARVKKKQAEQLVVQHKSAQSVQQQKVNAARAQVGLAQASAAKARRGYRDRLGVLEEDVRIADESVKQAEAAVEAEKAYLEALREQNPRIAVEAADVEILAKQAQIAKATLDLEHYVLRSPGKGKILRRFVNVGEAIGANPHRPAMEFAPEGELVVRAEIEQEFAGKVKKGMKAKIQDYDTTNPAVWEGEVTELSHWITKRRSQVYEPLQFNDVRTLEAIVEIKENGQKYALRIGQRVRVTLTDK